ncbi:hypothetical protein L4C36_13045 [Photobacterium japonica]|uniref:hypothetical protein n=1 Tax=Photobacterium japonica TaxID=2910235 RepID=UPI003D0B412B
MLSFLLTLILTLQIGVKGDDVTALRIDTPDGQTLYVWEDQSTWSSEGVLDDMYFEQHIPEVRAK